MGRFWSLGALLAAAALAAPLSALAGYGNPPPPPPSGQPPAEGNVNANGNAFSGGLGFVPRTVTVKVGQAVRWTNTDTVAPHTATEDHRLWRLSGTYAVAGFMGFGPGQSVQRRFAAGTWHYFCEVHPTQMHGIVRVPVTLRRSGSGVAATWAKQALVTGQVFDVQEKVGAAPFRTVRSGVRSLGGNFAARPGQRLSFRARVREKSDPSASSDYSPVARITAG